MAQEAPYKPLIPWSIIYASIHLFNDKHFQIILIDQNLERKTWKGKVKQAIGKGTLCAGVSSMTGSTIFYGLEFSKYIKTLFSDVPVVWGGVHATCKPEQTLQNKNIDIIVRYEGEETFRDLVYALYQKREIKNIPGISYKENGKISHNIDRPLINLNDLPKLPFDKIDLKKYITPSHIVRNKELRSVQFFVSRGCPENCHFCYNKSFNKRKYRVLKPSKIVKIIEEFLAESKKQNVLCNHIWFPDDHLFASKRQLKEMCELFQEKGISIKWSAYFHMQFINRLGDEFIRYLQSSGLVQLYCGVESGSERILNLINKRISIPLVNEINQRLNHLKIPVKYSFMGGIPTETNKELQKTVRLMLKLTKEHPLAETTRISIFCPYPGTELFEMVKKYGFKEPEKLEEWISLSKFVLFKNPWLPNEMKKTLQIISVISFFFDKSKYRFNPLMRILFTLYRPIARFRAQFGLYGSFIDTIFILWFQKWRIRIK